jgi:hypothetical protein
MIFGARLARAAMALDYDDHARLASYARAEAETQAMLYNGFDARAELDRATLRHSLRLAAIRHRGSCIRIIGGG